MRMCESVSEKGGGVHCFFVTSVTTVALDKSFEEIEPNLQFGSKKFIVPNKYN